MGPCPLSCEPCTWPAVVNSVTAAFAITIVGCPIVIGWHKFEPVVVECVCTVASLPCESVVKRGISLRSTPESGLPLDQATNSGRLGLDRWELAWKSAVADEMAATK